MSDAPRLWAVDANIVLRFLLRDVPHQWSQAATIWKAVREGRIIAQWDPVTLSEVVWVLSSQYTVPNAVISELLLGLVQQTGVVMPGKDRYVRALRLFASEVPHFGDACLCAAALETSEGRLLSFDRKLSPVPGIERADSIPD
jgi:predicted nucleic acid-binding protein